MNNQDDEAALQRYIDIMAICMQSKSLALNSDKCCFCTVSESRVRLHTYVSATDI